MSYISANGTLVESYQVEELQKAVASDLESSVPEVPLEELLAIEETKEPKVKNGNSAARNDPQDREETKS